MLPKDVVCTALLALSFLGVSFVMFVSTASTHRGASTRHALQIKEHTATKFDTLVLYTFSDTDPEYKRNLQYFIEYGLGGSNVQYVFILQQVPGSNITSTLNLPGYARYILHKNECFDWGTFGWAIKTGRVVTRQYKYIIFMNSSVRGPYLPSYYTGNTHWTTIYTSRISETVKLVGSTINCQPVYWMSDLANAMRQIPHVQSYVVATDQVGLQVLLEEETVFRCYKNLLDTVWHSEVGASRAILNAGFSIDSLMLKYAGVDWRDTSNWHCNGRQNPYADFAYDGLMINPLEVLFVKVKSYQLESDWITSKMAETYERWQRSQGKDISVNHHSFDKARFTYFLSKAISMSMRGPECFDMNYYQMSNPDIPKVDATWTHFVNQGQFEGRPFRFNCENLFTFPNEDVLQKATSIARMSMAMAHPYTKGDIRTKKGTQKLFGLP